MFRHATLRACAAAFGLLATAPLCSAADEISVEQLQGTIADLRAKNTNLERALVQANKAEKEASGQLAQIRLRLEALGKDLLDGGNGRAVQAVADLEVLRERNQLVEQAAGRLIGAVAAYIRQAVVSDPDSRQRLETALRELDTVLGFRQQPRANVRTGELQNAQIVSVDSASGMVVLNIGENQGAKTGMSFDVFRARQRYGKAVVADVRKAVAGAFVEISDSAAQGPRTGDTVALITE